LKRRRPDLTTSNSPKPSRTQVFISYSHRDADWLARLLVHLKPLERADKVDVWHDEKIKGGAKWRAEIEQNIAATKVAVLLVSADFLASDFIASDELPPLLKAAEEEGAVILSVILSASLFEETPALSQFQSVNSPQKPLIDMTRGEQEAVLVKVSKAVREALQAGGNGTAAAATSDGGEPASPSPAPAAARPAPSAKAQLGPLEEAYALFEQVHAEYMDSFRRYRDLVKNTKGVIGPDHPVLDAIRQDHVFTGGPREKLLGMTETFGEGALAPFASEVKRYLTGIRRKEIYLQRPNAPRMDFMRELEAVFGATPAFHAQELKMLKANAAYRERLKAAQPQHPLLELLEKDGKATKVTPAQSRRLKEYQILVSLDMVVERTQAQYAAVSREYFAAKKSLAA
jgi:hypothetical protein